MSGNYLSESLPGTSVKDAMETAEVSLSPHQDVSCIRNLCEDITGDLTLVLWSVSFADVFSGAVKVQ